MISPADVLMVAVCIGLIALEGNRGITPALADFLCVLTGSIIIRYAYVPLSENMRPSDAYLLLFLTVIVLTAVLSIYISTRLKVSTSGLEAGVGAVLGLGSGLILSYTFLQWLVIRYGMAAPIVRDSIVSWLLFDYTGFNELRQFLQTLMCR